MGRTSLRLASRRLSEFIRAQKQTILVEWEAHVRALPVAKDLDRPTLVDHIPALLDEIAQLADHLGDGESPALSIEVAERHALDRLEEGFDLTQVVSEFAALRDCVMRLWEREQVASGVIEDLRVLNHAIDRAVSVSVVRYTQARDRALQALDRIANAALDCRDLDDLLLRLLAVLRETTPAIDAASVLLVDDERVVLRASIGLDLEPGSFSARIGDGFAGQIAADRTSRMIESAHTDPTVLNPAVRAAGIRAYYGIPMLDDDTLIGVVTVGSRTAQTFSVQDRRLIAAMASRATTAINQHILRASAERRAIELGRLAEILELGAACIVIDPRWRVAFVNANQERLARLARADSLGRPLAELWPDLMTPASQFRAQLERAMTERVSVEIETYFAPLDMWTASSVFPMRDGSLAVFLRDVTPKKHAEHAEQAAHREAERALAVSNAVLSSSLVGIGFVDHELRYVHVNEALARINGKSVSDHLGRQVTDVLGPPGEMLAPVLRDVMSSGTAMMNIEIATPPDAPPLAQQFYLASYAPVQLSSGELLGVGAAVVDITERKHAERAFRFIADASAVLAATLDFEQTLQKTVELIVPEIGDACTIELVDEHGASRRALAHPPLPSSGASAATATISAPLIARGRALGTLTLRCIAPSTRVYGPQDSALLDALAARVAIALDNARLFDSAQQAVRQRETVLAVVSHDLRNPLNAIELASSMAIPQIEEPKVRKHVETIHRAAAKMTDLIDDLLDIASIQADRVALDTKPESTRLLIGEAVELHEPLARAKGILMEALPISDDAQVACDRGRVAQVFDNLLSNAVKFCRPGDAIRIRADIASDMVQFSVTDTGPGMSADVAAHVFELYWSAREHVKEGTGLGLAISRGIVEAHGGSISVTSAPGEGSTFHFTLPRV